VAIVWAWPSTVDAYAAAGKHIEVPRPDCPSCERAMMFWSGYWRTVRAGPTVVVWVRRCRCPGCRVTHALLPSFCLVGRSFGVEVIGPAVEAHVAGAGTRSISRAAHLEQSAVRHWCRRHLERARLGVAVVVILTAWSRPSLPPTEADALAAVHVLGGSHTALSPWAAVSLVTGGRWLSPPPTGSRAYSAAPSRRSMGGIGHEGRPRAP